jgi:hypothetical protein
MNPTHKILGAALVPVLAAALAACGGGGGSAGTPSNAGAGSSVSGGSASSGGTTPSTTAPVAAPTVSASIVDASDAAIASNSISASTASVRAVVRSAAGAPVASKLVTFTTDAAVGTLLQSSALTDANGIARVRINPASLTTAAAGTVTASANVDGATVQSTVDYQTSAANVALTGLATGSSSITALQSAAVSVKALVGGAAAASGKVSVNFTASCGTFSPATGATDSSGNVSTVYQSVGTCGGPVTLTAQAAGATAVSTSINVVAAQAANLLFQSVDRSTIFTSRATSGAKQATLKFQVVDASGAAMASQAVRFNLSSSAANAGVTFAGGSTATQTVTTDAGGIATVTISSGALPTPAVVNAVLAANSNIQASSLTLAVTSGVPTQRAASISASKLSIRGYRVDGATTAIGFRIADRQGNPVPAGTAVSFVASHGLVIGSCTLDNSSACTVTYTSQGTRPLNGRVVVLAYLDGEESFVDANGNNAYDNGESFTDIGTAYRDDNENTVFDAGEQTYPGGMTGTAACTSTLLNTPSVANTCDGIWSSNIRVRAQATIVLATENPVITAGTRTLQQARFTLADELGNSLPTGSTVSAALTTAGTSCSIVSSTPAAVPNTTEPSVFTVALNGDASCASANIVLTVTYPAS